MLDGSIYKRIECVNLQLLLLSLCSLNSVQLEFFFPLHFLRSSFSELVCGRSRSMGVATEHLRVQ